MTNRLTLIMIAAPALMLLIVIEMVRRRRLREDYSLLWLLTFIALLFLALLRNSLLERLAIMLGIFYPPTALFVVSFGFMLLILLQFSTVITNLAHENKRAAQNIALLSLRVHELEEKLAEQSRGDSPA
jgi:hypothetical protein